MTASADTRAALGEAVLDERGPRGWRTRLDLDAPDLHLANPDWGLLRQVGYGGYWQAVDVLFGHLTQEYTQQHWYGVKHGFSPDLGSRDLAGECEALREAWRAIAARRQARAA